MKMVTPEQIPFACVSVNTLPATSTDNKQNTQVTSKTEDYKSAKMVAFCCYKRWFLIVIVQVCFATSESGDQPGLNKIAEAKRDNKRSDPTGTRQNY